MRNYITEFIGTFFLVLVIGLAGAAPLGAVAIGCTLMVMVYMGGHISGAHYNPAVSLAVLLRGRLAVRDLIPYWIAQLAGAAAAAALVRHVFGHAFAGPVPGVGVSPLQAVTGEILMTFALALVVLNVATAKATAGNSYYGAAIGLTVLAGAVAVGPISGGAFNPAVGVGPHLINGDLRDLWIYIIGPLVGGFAAAVIFRVQHPADA